MVIYSIEQQTVNLPADQRSGQDSGIPSESWCRTPLFQAPDAAPGFMNPKGPSTNIMRTLDFYIGDS